MTVTFPEPLAEFVRRKVAAGEFASTEAVIHEALRRWQEEQDWDAAHAGAVADGLRDLEHGDYTDYNEAELRTFFQTLNDRTDQVASR